MILPVAGETPCQNPVSRPVAKAPGPLKVAMSLTEASVRMMLLLGTLKSKSNSNTMKRAIMTKKTRMTTLDRVRVALATASEGS